jgi:hypothetical protein
VIGKTAKDTAKPDKDTRYSSGVTGFGSPQESLDGLRCRSEAAREKWVSDFPHRKVGV